MCRIFFLVVTFNLFCGTLLGQVFSADSISHQGLVRKFQVFVPASYSGAEPLPMVVFLHGGGGNAESASGFTLFNLVAGMEGFLMAYPQAYAEISEESYVWADGRGTLADELEIDDVDFVNTLVDSLGEQYNIDQERIYLSGFSNGSFMTQRVAMEANESFAAMASLGSTMDINLFNQGDPGRAIPMAFFFGTSDPFVPIEGGMVGGLTEGVPVVGIDDAVNFWVENNQCQTEQTPVELPDSDPSDSSTVTFFEFTDCDCDDSRVVYYRINNAGHTWPGVENPSYELIAGQTNEDIFASQEIWDFFSGYQLCQDPLYTQPEPSHTNPLAFPSPFDDWLTIRHDLESVTIELRSVAGKLIHSIDSNSPTVEMDVSSLTSGIYVIRIYNESGVNRMQKVVKR